MTSDPQTEIENTSRKASILCDSLRGLTSFLSLKSSIEFSFVCF